MTDRHPFPRFDQKVESLLPRITADGNRLFGRTRRNTVRSRIERQRIVDRRDIIQLRPQRLVFAGQHHEFFQFFQLPDQLRVPVFFDRIPDETGKHPVVKVAVIGTVEVDLPDFHAAVRNGIQEIDVPAQQRNRNIRLQLA